MSKSHCPRCKPSKLGYMQAHYDARRRLKRGERQVRCPGCGRWKWQDQLKPTDERRSP